MRRDRHSGGAKTKAICPNNSRGTATGQASCLPVSSRYALEASAIPCPSMPFSARNHTQREAQAMSASPSLACASGKCEMYQTAWFKVG